MRRRVALCLVLSAASVAHADDPRDVFGLGKKPAPAPAPKAESGDVRDVFGLGKKPVAEAIDCSDGTEFGCAGASDPLDEHASLFGLASWLSARYLLSLPVANATHEAVAHYALGAGRDEAGPTFAGATGLENRWLIDGAPADDLRTGVADTRIPLSFLDGMWVTAGGFTARDRNSTGGVIDAELRGGTATHELDARAWLGWTAETRKRAIVANTYYTRRRSFDFGPDAELSLVATGPLGEFWYAVGVAPELSQSKFRWTAQRLVDRDGDEVPDGYPGVVDTEFIREDRRTPLTWRVPVMLRAGIDHGVHHANVTIIGAAENDTTYQYNTTLQAAGVDGTNVEGDAIATWRGTWKKTRAKVQLAWHRTMRWESATDAAAANTPQLLSAYVPSTLADDPAIADACRDPDPDDDFAPCLVPAGWFISGGAGPLTNTTGDRPSLSADIAHAIGNHVVRAGATGEDTRLVRETHFTGGTQIRSLFPGHESQRRFADPDRACSTDAAEPCPTVDTSVLRYRTRYTAAYVEDTWQAAPNLAVDGGLRWELMWVGTVLHFSDQFAPRLGLSWERPLSLPAPLGNGRVRAWASMGRSYAYLPAGLGPTVIRGEKTVERVISMFGEGRAVETGAPWPVAPDIEPIAQDEVTTGAQLGFPHALQVTTWLQGRWLRRGLDTTPTGFDNPGRHGGIPAIRDTGLFAIELATDPVAKLALRVGYMYGRTIGSWTGAFDPREGAVLYAGSEFDATSVNLLGRLPTDLGHRTYIEAERRGSVGSMKLVFAMRLTAASGRPRSVVAETLDGTSFLLPRGAAGRNPLVSQANIRLGAQWHGVDITLDLFNVFNRREVVATDELHVRGPVVVHPIDNGTVEDLVFLKTEDGASPPRWSGFGTATSFQVPFSAVLGAQRTF